MAAGGPAAGPRAAASRRAADTPAGPSSRGRGPPQRLGADRCGARRDRVGTRRLVIDPVALDFDERGTLYATSTSRDNLPLDIRAASRPGSRGAHAADRGRPAGLLPPRAGAGAERRRTRGCPTPTRTARATGAISRKIKERLYRNRGYRRRRPRGSLPDHDRRLQRRSHVTTSPAACSITTATCSSAPRRRSGGCATRTATASSTRRSAVSQGYNVHPAFGGHGISGVTLGPDGRLYWEVGDMGFDVVDQSGRRWSYPNQGAVLRANPDGSDFEVFATGIRNLQEFAFDEYGNLISVDNDGDHPGETERLVYLTEGSDSGWRANWQYGKYTDPANNRYNVWMDEGMFKPRFDGQAAHITPPIAPYHAGPGGDGLRPRNRAVGRVAESFLRRQLSEGRRPTPRIHAFRLRTGGRRLRAGERQGPAAGHPDGRPEVRSRMARCIWPTGSRGWDSKDEGRIWKVDAPAAGVERRREAKCGRCSRRASTARSRRRSRPAAAACRHARAAEGPVRAGPPRRRHDASGLTARRAEHQLARIHGLWGIAPARPEGPAALGAARGIPRRSRSGDPRAGRQDDRRRA